MKKYILKVQKFVLFFWANEKERKVKQKAWI
jgi:hypothetical protein